MRNWSRVCNAGTDLRGHCDAHFRELLRANPMAVIIHNLGDQRVSIHRATIVSQLDTALLTSYKEQYEEPA